MRLSILTEKGLVKTPKVVVGAHVKQIGGTATDAAKALALAGPGVGHMLTRTVEGAVSRAQVAEGTLEAREIYREFLLAEGITPEAAEKAVKGIEAKNGAAS